MTRILVTGSRDWTWEDSGVIVRALLEVLRDPDTESPTLVVGDCMTGADNIAAYLWKHDDGVCITAGPDRTRVPEVYRARWHKLGKKAGPLRNQAMVDSGADICLAFPIGASRGTRDCMRRAVAAGIPVRNYGDIA